MTFLHSPQRLPGAGGKPATLRIHKTPGACGDLAEKKKQVLLNRGPGFDDTNQGLQNRKGSIIGGLKNHVFNAALSYSPQPFSPGLAES